MPWRVAGGCWGTNRPGEIRTLDQWIKSPLLCQLSYGPNLNLREPTTGVYGAAFAPWSLLEHSKLPSALVADTLCS